MTLKFRIGFTIDSETMFGMLAKFLPVENLHVEEMVERAPPSELPPRRIQHAKFAKPKMKRAKPEGRKANLKAGVNGHVIRFLSDGQARRAIEIKPILAAAGYAASGIGSRLQKLKEAGIVFQPEPGLWRLEPAHLDTTQTQTETAA